MQVAPALAVAGVWGGGAFLAGIVALGAVAAVAADAPPRELLLFEEPPVSAATKNPAAVRDVPSAVTVVTREEIRRFGYRTLAEVLRSVRGFYGSYDRNYDYIGVRGFLRPGDYNDRILVLVNGHTYNDDIYQTALLGHEFGLDLEAVDRVEIIRGPGSALYGGNALFAVVNVVTREGGDVGGVEARVQGGSFGRMRGALLGGTRIGDAEVMASGSIYDADGPRRLVFPQGVAHDIDGERAYDFFLSARQGGWALQGGANRREKQLPTGAFDTTFDAPGTQTVDSRRFADLSYTATPLAAVTVTARGYYDSYRYHGTYIYGATKNEDLADSHWVGTEVRARWQTTATNALTAGVEATYHPEADQRNYDLPSGTTYLVDRRSYATWGLYAQDEWAVTERLRLVAGLRYDAYYDGGIEEWSPRGAVVWHPFDVTTLKLLVGRAFRPPNLYEQYYMYAGAGADQLANPDLGPELITTYEAVLEQELPAGVRGEIALYRYDIEDLIDQVTLPGSQDTQYRNIGDVEAHGFETELRIPLPRRSSLRTHYTLQKATSDGHVLDNSPRHLGGLALLVPLPLGIQGAAELLVVGPRRTRTGARLEAARLVNLYFTSPTPIPGVSLGFGLYNLLDHTYPDPVGAEIRSDRIAQDGLTFRFEVGYAF
jgi:iron complex outermembrane receptor protein